MGNDKRVAIYGGSFDPITLGHMSMIIKASQLFDRVVVGVLTNRKKTPTFTVSERVKFVKRCVANLPNVEVDASRGMLVDLAAKHGAGFVVRGLRNVADFENEFLIARVNKRLGPDVETVLLFPDAQFQNVSSSLAKELAFMSADVSWLIPGEILNDVLAKLPTVDD